VVPPLSYLFEKLVRRYFEKEPIIVDATLPHGIEIMIDTPSELGSDRLMGALAAHTLFKGNCITVDFGTATTLEVITEEGSFLGGVIFPGIRLSADSLHSGTAKLPRIDFRKPKSVLGKNTVASMQSGLYYGYIELVDGLIDRLVKESFRSGGVKLLSTGGMGRELSLASRHKLHYEPNLVSIGLYIMYEKVVKR
jgi:type III pantothenate kinase